jgi:MoaA/NifB/PqqE/SkfB family radical SAM enzyme
MVLSRIDIESYKTVAGNNPLLRPFYKLSAQSMIDRRFPKHLFIESTSLCNLSCVMCTRDTSRLGHMKFDLFQKIIDEGVSYGPKSFSLHLFGEPLLHPQLVDMVAYIKSRTVRNSVFLTTNGLKLDEALFRELVRAGIDRISISLLAANGTQYKEITGSAHFGRLEDTLLRLAEINQRENNRRPRVSLRYLVGDETREELAPFVEKWSNSGFNLEIRPRHNLGGHFDGSDISRDLFQRRWPCYHLWYGPGVTYDGDFTICCNDPCREAVIGNVCDETVAALWQSESMDRIRQSHMAGDYDSIRLCAGCDVWAVYSDIFFGFQKG